MEIFEAFRAFMHEIKAYFCVTVETKADENKPEKQIQVGVKL